MKLGIQYCTFLMIVFSFSCNYEAADNNDTPKIQDSVNYAKNEKDSAENRSEECFNTIRSFLKWYKSNFSKILSIQLVDLHEDSTTAQYRVNFKNAEKYISVLRSAGFFSERFLQEKLQYFKEADRKLIDLKQNDGPPEGFDADLLLFTQDMEAVFEKVETLQLEKINPNLIKLISVDNNLLINVSESNGKCLIDKISFSRK